MEELWCPIQDFPGYSVSNFGRVSNDATGRDLAQPSNQQGYAMVALRLEKRQYMRSVSTLVADAFLEEERSDFNSIVHKNGDRSDCRVTNLARRPRWYAIRYHRQFEYFRWHGKFHPSGFEVPVCEPATGRTWDTSAYCAIDNGLLEIDVMLSVGNGTPTAMTGQVFALA